MKDQGCRVSESPSLDLQISQLSRYRKMHIPWAFSSTWASMYLVKTLGASEKQIYKIVCGVLQWEY